MAMTTSSIRPLSSTSAAEKPLRVWLAGPPCTPPNGPSTARWRQYQLRDVYERVETRHLPFPCDTSGRLREGLRMMHWRPDVIHAFGGSREAWAAARWARTLRCPWIFQPDGAVCRSSWKEEPDWKRADTLVVEDRAARERVNVRSGRLSAIVPPPWRVAARPAAAQDRETAIWVGEDASADGWMAETVLRALGALKAATPLHLDLRVEAKALDRLRPLADALPRNRKVTLLASAQGLLRTSSWHQAEAYLDLGSRPLDSAEAALPSRAAREAVARHVGVIAAPETPLHGLIAHQQTGLHLDGPDRVSTLAVLDHALEHREHLPLMGRNLHEFASWHFDPASTAQQLEGIYRDVVGLA